VGLELSLSLTVACVEVPSSARRSRRMESFEVETVRGDTGG